MNVQEISLDLSKRPNAVELVMLGQGDRSGTTIRATIYDNGTLLDSTGLSANLVMRLPDRKHYYRKGASLSNGVASVTVDETFAASIAGQTDEAYFQVLRGDEVIASSSRFCVRILRSALEGTIKPESYDDKVNDAITATINANNAAQNANTAAATMTSARQAAEEATANANSAAAYAVSTADTAAATAVSTANAAADRTTQIGTNAANAEAARVTAENARVTAENARASAERGRSSAESARVTAENARQTASTNATNAANTAASNAQAVADDLTAAKARGEFDAEIAEATITVGQDIGNARASVTLGGIPGAQTFDFAFDGVKGEKGEPGDTHSFAISKDGQTITLAGTDASTSSVTLTNADIIALLGYVPQPSVASIYAWRKWDELDVATWADLLD